MRSRSTAFCRPPTSWQRAHPQSFPPISCAHHNHDHCYILRQRDFKLVNTQCQPPRKTARSLRNDPPKGGCSLRTFSISFHELLVPLLAKEHVRFRNSLTSPAGEAHRLHLPTSQRRRYRRPECHGSQSSTADLQPWLGERPPRLTARSGSHHRGRRIAEAKIQQNNGRRFRVEEQQEDDGQPKHAKRQRVVQDEEYDGAVKEPKGNGREVDEDVSSPRPGEQPRLVADNSSTLSALHPKSMSPESRVASPTPPAYTSLSHATP